MHTVLVIRPNKLNPVCVCDASHHVVLTNPLMKEHRLLRQPQC